MTLYDALVKAEEVRSASDTTRLTQSAYYALNDFDISLTERFLFFDTCVPESLKNFRITTTRPKRGLIAKCRKVGLFLTPDSDAEFVEYETDSGLRISICGKGLNKLFGKVPDFLFLSKKVEIAK